MIRKAPLKQGKPLQRGKPMNRAGAIKAKPSHTKSIAGPATPKPPAAPKRRSTLKPSRPAHTAEESRHMGRVAALGCICCSECLGIEGTPAIVHHLRTGQGRMRASHFDTLPLCPFHHQDSGQGVHDMGREQFAELYGRTEVELLHVVQTRLAVPLWVTPYPAGT